MSTFSIVTLGCKVNQYESAGIGEALRGAGWSAAAEAAPADLIIINTCTVTSKASMQARQRIRQVIRNHPEARVVVTGCDAEIQPKEILAIDGVDAVIGNHDKHRIVGAVLDALQETRDSRTASSQGGRRTEPLVDLPVTRFDGRTRPFLKIQDGCDAFCTYCIVPYTRGRSRSLPMDAVLERLRVFKSNGYREVVLTGIHLGAYGGDLSPTISLVELLKRADAPGIPDRIRLSSIEPTEITDALLNVVAGSNRFCNHFHIPLQSADDGVLRRMHRPYTGAAYAGIVQRIHDRLSNAAIGADVLVGFPGEDETAFLRTRDLIAALPLTYLHVFPFSPREGTPAARFSDPVTTAEAKTRCAELRQLGAVKRVEFYRTHRGQSLPVIVESRRDRRTGRLRGLSDNYIPILFEGSDAVMERIVSVAVTDVDDRGRVMGRAATEKYSAAVRGDG